MSNKPGSSDFTFEFRNGTSSKDRPFTFLEKKPIQLDDGNDSESSELVASYYHNPSKINLDDFQETDLLAKGDDFISFGNMEDVALDDRPAQTPLADIDILMEIPTPCWVPENRVYSSDVNKHFRQEIQDFVEFMSPTSAEIQMRNLTLSRLRGVVDTVFENAEVLVFGSFETNLFLPSSDLDVVIIQKNPNKGRENLSLLANALRKNDIVSHLEVISNAKVPLIKTVDKFTRYSMDISFNLSNGIQSAKIFKNLLANERCGDALRPLMLILKQFLLQRHLNEVFTGGLGSYGLLITVSAFLMSHPRLQTGQINAKDNLGILLLEFLELYGKNLNYSRVGVGLDLRKGGFFFDKLSSNSSLEPARGDKLAIQDPQDSSNDVGRGSYSIYSIKSHFARAYHRVTFMIGRYIHMQKSYDSRKSNVKPPRLKSVLGTILTVNRAVLEHRQYVEETWLESQALGKVGHASIPIERKRKRGPSHRRFAPVNDEDEIEYFEEISCDEEEDILDDTRLTTKRFKPENQNDSLLIPKRRKG